MIAQSHQSYCEAVGCGQGFHHDAARCCTLMWMQFPDPCAGSEMLHFVPCPCEHVRRPTYRSLSGRFLTYLDSDRTKHLPDGNQRGIFRDRGDDLCPKHACQGLPAHPSDERPHEIMEECTV